MMNREIGAMLFINDVNIVSTFSEGCYAFEKMMDFEVWIKMFQYKFDLEDIMS